MPKSFSIAEARHNLAAVVHELDRKPRIQFTRRGKPVAVLLSIREMSVFNPEHGGLGRVRQISKAEQSSRTEHWTVYFGKDLRDQSTGARRSTFDICFLSQYEHHFRDFAPKT